jgi:glycosyltransferase involved in cell wall biosynthesis
MGPTVAPWAPPGLDFGPPLVEIEDADCDVLIFYANNAIIGLEPMRPIWTRLAAAAGRCVLVLNWRIHDAALPWFVPLWDRVGFLSTGLRDQWVRLTGCRRASTFVLAPAVDLEPFAALQPDYSRIVFARHSKAAKWPKDAVSTVEALATGCPRARFECMGMPPKLALRFRARFDSRSRLVPEFAESVPSFLAHGSVFWYTIKPRATEQGPRVIVEAMAAGLPVIAEAREGMKDRVTPETGWLVSSRDEIRRVATQIAKQPGLLQLKGRAARERAMTEFRPERWIGELVGSIQKVAHGSA